MPTGDHPASTVSYFLFAGRSPRYRGQEQHEGLKAAGMSVNSARPTVSTSHLGAGPFGIQTARQHGGFQDEQGRGQDAQHAVAVAAHGQPALGTLMSMMTKTTAPPPPPRRRSLDRREEVGLAQHEQRRHREQGEDQESADAIGLFRSTMIARRPAIAPNRMKERTRFHRSPLLQQRVRS